ncbi:MAG TPA: hypothetical protein VFF06_17360 [Polyangia bacterium]|nr:hypothetical protein [Polyangia bacterium]
MRLRRAVAISALLAGACSRSSSPPAPPPPPSVSPAIAAAGVPAEVELRGHVTAPKDAKGETRVYVTDGECWKPGTSSLEDVRATESGDFFAEVIVKQGTLLWVCAAIVPPSGPLAIYGALPSAPLRGEGSGEVTFNNLSFALAPGKPVERPPHRSVSTAK